MLVLKEINAEAADLAKGDVIKDRPVHLLKIRTVTAPGQSHVWQLHLTLMEDGAQSKIAHELAGWRTTSPVEQAETTKPTTSTWPNPQPTRSTNQRTRKGLCSRNCAYCWALSLRQPPARLLAMICLNISVNARELIFSSR